MSSGLRSSAGLSTSVGSSLCPPRAMVAYVKAEEPDTLTYIFNRAAKDPRTFLFFERYAGPEALDIHEKSSQMAKLLAVVGPILDGAPEIEPYEELESKQ